MDSQHIRLILNTTLAFCVSLSLYAQPSTAGASDPAQNYNIITRDKFSNMYTLVGAYKVRGNPYLYGGKNEGKFYSTGSAEAGGTLSYNTFNQQVEYGASDAAQPIIQDIKTVDSFTLSVSTDAFIGNIKFVNASRWDPKNKFFVQQVSSGGRYTLYKRFYSELAVVSTNYVQSELREFELNYEYYYADSSKPGIKKLKTSENGLKSEFAEKKACWNEEEFEGLTTNKEKVLIDLFEKLNSCK